jgi:hypothetical protein
MGLFQNSRCVFLNNPATFFSARDHAVTDAGLLKNQGF